MIHTFCVLTPDEFLNAKCIDDPCEAINALCYRMEEMFACLRTSMSNGGKSSERATIRMHIEVLRSAIGAQEERAAFDDSEFRVQWQRDAPELNTRYSGLTPACLRKHGHMANENFLHPRK